MDSCITPRVRRVLAQVKGCLLPQPQNLPEQSDPVGRATRLLHTQDHQNSYSEDSNQSLFQDSNNLANMDTMAQDDIMATQSFMDDLQHSSGDGSGGAPPDPQRTERIAAAAAAAAVDKSKVASMLDALALQQPLFMSSKYVKIADLNRHGPFALLQSDSVSYTGTSHFIASFDAAAFTSKLSARADGLRGSRMPWNGAP